MVGVADSTHRLQAVAGVFAAVASLLSQVASSSVHGEQNPITDSAYGYFSLACVVLILCLASVFLLSKMVS